MRQFMRRCEIRNSVDAHRPGIEQPGPPGRATEEACSGMRQPPPRGRRRPSTAAQAAGGPSHRRYTWCIHPDFFYKNSNVPSCSDQIIDRGVGVAATRQRSRFPTHRAFQCVHPPNELPLVVGLRAPQPEAPPIRLCALIDSSDMRCGGIVTTPMAAGAFSGYRRSAAG